MSSVSFAQTSRNPTLPEPVRPADVALLDDDEDTRVRVLVVEVSETVYGINVDQTREVLRAVRLTPVPGAPLEVLGIANVRGAVVTVLDLGVILHGVRAVTGASVVLIENGARLVGFAVDAVRDVRALDPDDGTRAGGRPASGIATLDATALCARYLISAEEMGR